jgi:hypothetical protein
MLAISYPQRPPSGYQAGVCNIGPAEIAARRRAGHVGALVTIVAFVLLVIIDAPAPSRLLLFLPAAAAASGYLQAWLHFCANFGLRGVFNISRSVGRTDSVAEAEARATDRRKALEIIGLSVLIAAVVAIGAAVLPF